MCATLKIKSYIHGCKNVGSISVMVSEKVFYQFFNVPFRHVPDLVVILTFLINLKKKTALRSNHLGFLIGLKFSTGTQAMTIPAKFSVVSDKKA